MEKSSPLKGPRNSKSPPKKSYQKSKTDPGNESRVRDSRSCRFLFKRKGWGRAVWAIIFNSGIVLLSFFALSLSSCKFEHFLKLSIGFVFKHLFLNQNLSTCHMTILCFVALWTWQVERLDLFFNFILGAWNGKQLSFWPGGKNKWIRFLRWVWKRSKFILLSWIENRHTAVL